LSSPTKAPLLAMKCSAGGQLQCCLRQRGEPRKNPGTPKRPASSAPSCVILSFCAVFGKPPALGSARVSHVGERVLAIASFVVRAFAGRSLIETKDCFSETPKPTRETRAFPRLKFDVGCSTFGVERWTFSGRRAGTGYTLYLSRFLCRCALIRLRRLCLAIFAFRLFLSEPIQIFKVAGCDSTI
jgi:hypothetical protein